MALATGGGGKVQSRARAWCAFIEAQRRPLTGSSRLCYDRCLKRGHFDEGRNLVLLLGGIPPVQSLWGGTL